MGERGRPSDARLESVIRAGISISAERGLEAVLQTIADSARDVIGARYAAIGVLDVSGTGLSRFMVSGLNLEQRAAIGSLPQGHGILGMLIAEPQPLRLDDLTTHPKSAGFPPNHPPMHSFLGVPIPGRRGPIGNLYITEKREAASFSTEDEQIAVLFAAQAGIAVENAELNEESQRLLAEVRDMQSSRDRFFATINHELRNALTAVYGWSELLVRKLGDDVPQAAREVHEAAERTLALLNDLLDLSRLEADRLRLNIREADPRMIVEEAVRTTEPTATACGVSIVVAWGDIPSHCHTDAQRVRQILVNLLSNAIRHSPDGAPVDVRVTSDRVACTIRVADRGEGIPAAMQEHIFDAFTRGTADDRGTGLGLTLSRQLARLLGGNLTVTSTPGAGAAFTLTLPFGVKIPS
ncbi:MAG: GAF domain-containing sensor histidine kinase [Gemmatimonadales bacterium]